MQTRNDHKADLVSLSAFARELHVNASTAGRLVQRLGMRQYVDPVDRRKRMVSMDEYRRLAQPIPLASEHPTIVPSPFQRLPGERRLGWLEKAGGLDSPAVRFERGTLSQPPDRGDDVPDVTSDLPGQRIGMFWDYLPRG